MSDRNITLTPQAARKLADTITRRRVELGMRSARSVGIESGLDYRTITSLEACRRDNVSRNTLAVLEMTLQWPAGYLQALIDSADRSTAATTVAIEVPEGTDPDAVLRARAVAQAAFNAAISGMQG